MIKLCENYSIKYQIKFNSTKSNVIALNNTEKNPNFNYVMKNLAIPVVNYCKHLGIVISNKNLINIIKHMNVKTNVILN